MKIIVIGDIHGQDIWKNIIEKEKNIFELQNQRYEMLGIHKYSPQEKYLRDAIGEYSKRLSKYCKLEIIEVADEKTPERASEVVEESIRSKEGERILKYIKEDAPETVDIVVENEDDI